MLFIMTQKPGGLPSSENRRGLEGVGREQGLATGGGQEETSPSSHRPERFCPSALASQTLTHSLSHEGTSHGNLGLSTNVTVMFNHTCTKWTTGRRGQEGEERGRQAGGKGGEKDQREPAWWSC